MSIFKRISTTLVSRIDQVVGEIENHDAVIQANLDDMRKKVAEAKVRLNQVRREERRLTQQIEEQQANAQRWRERALECAQDDEGKALECVRRSRHCQQQTKRLQQDQAQYSQSADKLAHDIETSEQRLMEMKQKLALMRARQSTSSAMNATSEPDSNTSRQLDESFDRWEINISQAEMAVDHYDAADPMEREFASREQQQALRDELATLLREETQK